MSVISSKHKEFRNVIRTMTDDSDIIRLCEEYSRKAERMEAVCQERQRQAEVILAESRENAQKCVSGRFFYSSK